MGQLKREERKPHRDPLLRAVNGKQPESVEEITKEGAPGQANTGTPTAGRTTISEAKRKGPLGIFQLLGPGLITGASDDDPSGIGTYSQVGSQYGYGLLWTALFTFPLMAAVQELCARIALQTGVGLGVVLRRKFPSALVGVCVLALLIANTINVGADLGAVAAGGSLLSGGWLKQAWLVVPAGLLILGLQFYVSYALIFKIFKWLTLALFAYVITAFFAHPPLVEVVKATVIPHVELSKDFVMALVAVLGTTISPYLFFWQASQEVEEEISLGRTRLTQRRGATNTELRYAGWDVAHLAMTPDTYSDDIGGRRVGRREAAIVAAVPSGRGGLALVVSWEEAQLASGPTWSPRGVGRCPLRRLPGDLVERRQERLG